MCLTPPHFYTIEICAYVLMMQPQLQFLRCDNFGSIVLKAINLSFPPSISFCIFESPPPLQGGLSSYVFRSVAIIMLLCLTWPFWSKHVYVGLLILLYCTLVPLHWVILYCIKTPFFLIGLAHLCHGTPLYNFYEIPQEAWVCLPPPYWDLVHISPFWLVVNKWFSVSLLQAILLSWTLYLLGPSCYWIKKIWWISVIQFSPNLTY